MQQILAGMSPLAPTLTRAPCLTAHVDAATRHRRPSGSSWRPCALSSRRCRAPQLTVFAGRPVQCTCTCLQQHPTSAARQFAHLCRLCSPQPVSACTTSNTNCPSRSTVSVHPTAFITDHPFRSMELAPHGVQHTSCRALHRSAMPRLCLTEQAAACCTYLCVKLVAQHGGDARCHATSSTR